MLAIDTNVVVRLLVRDDPSQAERARDLLETNDIVVSSTVVLETDWVLRSAYAFSRTDVLQALSAFLGLPRVHVREPSRVRRALDWAAEGLDLADALHLAAADGCEAFVSFDRRLIKRAKGVDLSVREP